MLFAPPCFFVQAENLHWGSGEVTFASAFSNHLFFQQHMTRDDKEINKKRIVQEDHKDENGDEMDFVKDFIERKKLQNRVLRDIIENIKQTDKD